jgi:hypothetical protein
MSTSDEPITFAHWVPDVSGGLVAGDAVHPGALAELIAMAGRLCGAAVNQAGQSTSDLVPAGM